VNSTAINMSVKVSLLHADLTFLQVNAQEHYGSCILVFKGTSIVTSILDALFYNPAQGSFFSHHQHLLFVFLVIARLAGVRWNLSVVLRDWRRHLLL
jgi:hypothetical protein